MPKALPTNRVCCAVALSVALLTFTLSCEQNGRMSTGQTIATVEPVGPYHEPVGYLIVYTEARPFANGDMTYYPHRPYKIYDEAGGLVQSVANHRSNYDEKPTTVELSGGRYFIVPQGGGPSRPRIAVVIKGGELTKVDVEALLKARGRH